MKAELKCTDQMINSIYEEEKEHKKKSSDDKKTEQDFEFMHVSSRFILVLLLLLERAVYILVKERMKVLIELF